MHGQAAAVDTGDPLPHAVTAWTPRCPDGHPHAPTTARGCSSSTTRPPCARCSAALSSATGFVVAEAADAAEAVRALPQLRAGGGRARPRAAGPRRHFPARRAAGSWIPGRSSSSRRAGATRRAPCAAGRASFFRKPFLLPELVQEVRQLAAWRSRRGHHGRSDLPAARSASRSARREAHDPSLIGALTLPLEALLDEAELLGVRIGIGEMITNAVEHGNLGISATEKEEALADGRFAALLASRLAMPSNAGKRVWIESRLADGEFRVTVRDEGAGFDWRALAVAEPGATLAGRGVLLARVHFDEVRWNERGNEVTLVKRVPGL